MRRRRSRGRVWRDQEERRRKRHWAGVARRDLGSHELVDVWMRHRGRGGLSRPTMDKLVRSLFRDVVPSRRGLDSLGRCRGGGCDCPLPI